MKNVFGPVPSRRLGRSLGIDPVPLKTCNWNCVYCQLGRSLPPVNERREFFPREEMIDEFGRALANHGPGEIDWITFIGSGETTLHAGIGWLIRQVKARTSLPVAVITNGSLLCFPETREALAFADAVLPSLDAGDARLYRKINRPHPDIRFERLIEGLLAFRNEYRGKLWIEVMLVRGLNDTEAALRKIATTLANIRPDEIHIVQPDRPSSEPWVQSPDKEGMLGARTIFGDVARIIHPTGGDFKFSGNSSLVDAVVEIITRHPMREDELTETLRRWSPGEWTAILKELEESGKAQAVKRYGIRFWCASAAHYPSPDFDASGGRSR
jgi:wyosine [tRNA(Phe)-imidazoG37] synthetase (radical SAM superfamily)